MPVFTLARDMKVQPRYLLLDLVPPTPSVCVLVSVAAISACLRGTGDELVLRGSNEAL